MRTRATVVIRAVGAGLAALGALLAAHTFAEQQFLWAVVTIAPIASAAFALPLRGWRQYTVNAVVVCAVNGAAVGAFAYGVLDGVGYALLLGPLFAALGAMGAAAPRAAWLLWRDLRRRPLDVG